MTEDTRDRLIKLESKVEHMSDTLDEVSTTVKELNTLLQQAKGAKWAIMGAAAIGGFVSAKVAAFIPWASLGPKV